MEENNTKQTGSIYTRSVPTKNPDHGQDPRPPAAVNDGEEEEENPETIREAKRRKTCSIALDKQKTSMNSSFSFFCGSGASTPETTPKFGSFNLVVESAKIRGPEKARDDGEVEATAEKNVVSGLDSTDGIETVI